MNKKIRMDSPRLQTIILFLSIVVIFALLSIFVKNFFAINNFKNILLQVAPIGIMACGVTFVLVTGGIDISCPAMMAASAVIGADFMAKTGNLLVGGILIVLIGAFFGFINGAAVAYLKMVPLVVTLSMMTICLGLSTTWTQGDSSVHIPATFSEIINPTVVTIMFLILAVLLDLVLRKTVFGRWLYTIGNNEKAALISGIPTKRATCTAYIISGMCAGIAGIFNVAALSSARASMGPDTQILDIISAAVIGGVSVNGGVGSVIGATAGAIFIIAINNVMNLIGVSDYYTGLIKGLIIIIAMGIEALRMHLAQTKLIKSN